MNKITTKESKKRKYALSLQVNSENLPASILVMSLAAERLNKTNLNGALPSNFYYQCVTNDPWGHLSCLQLEF